MIENPILEAANQIRANTESLVSGNFKGIFPRNYEYRHGDYNRVFIPMKGYGEQGGGFFRRADMVTLESNGQFQSGSVKQRVGNDNAVWEFREATLTPASDLTVVRYSPRLLLDLFKQLEREYVDFDSPNKIDLAIQALSKKAVTIQDVMHISRQALIEMGEDNPELPGGDQDYGIAIMPVLTEIISEMNPASFTPSFEQRKAAFSYFKRMGDLRAEVSDLCSIMRVRPVEDWFKQLTQNMVSENVFPVTLTDKDGIEWFYPTKPFSHEIRSSHSSYGRAGKDDEIWHWGISKSGDVREIKYMRRNQDGTLIAQRCPEHLLQDGPTITSALIHGNVLLYFPKLKTGTY